MLQILKDLYAKLLPAKTQTKILYSALISLGGFVVINVPILVKELTDYITSSDPINLNIILIAGLGSIGSWIVATAREILKNVPADTGEK